MYFNLQYADSFTICIYLNIFESRVYSFKSSKLKADIGQKSYYLRGFL